ncbi:AAA ATPase2C central domain protein [Corallococcus coralloides]|uniref:AAA ATPase2C central domain protein n=1 Tax=Corallococcus coralloides TaxID=184914 RepID=A0A410RS76_CORCK|nr:AAA family ATPase [Corallococcus coralloides]QAT84726.1 AAA ATPase2C central domain protein [Corallococcus coralloides]
MDPLWGETLRRLDALLVQVCDLEEARASKLRGEQEAGWDAVRTTVRPSTAELAFSSALAETPLLGASPPLPFARLRASLRVDPVEEEALLLLLATWLEPRYSRLFAVLQDETAQGWNVERLLLTVLGRTPARAQRLLASLTDSGLLVGSGLLQTGAGAFPPMLRPVDLAPEVREALLELPRPSVLGELSLEWHGPEALPSSSRGTFAVVHGEGERLGVALGLADEAGVPLVVARWAGAPEPVPMARALWRLASVRGALLAVDMSGAERGLALSVTETLSGLCRRFGGRALVLADSAQPVAVPHHEAPAPGFVQRRALWVEEARARGLSLREADAGRLASGFRGGLQEIRRVFDSAPGGDAEALRAAASRLVQVPLRHGYRLETSRTFAELVVRDTTRAALERLLFYVAQRDRVAEERGLSRRFRLHTGPVALFSGRSGTGKTLAAEVIAHAVGRPLYVIDLSRLVSKYVGETEKNIDEVLSHGERSGAVLFFDEADSLFSSRTEVSNANDRFANLEVGFLLQRIERHDGLIILATNLQTAIDEAFLRRFHARIEFPFPEVDERRRIWELMLPEGVPRAGTLDLAGLAQRHRLAGGDIRNAALKAIFLAEQAGAPLAQEHLERAVALELYELGRLSRRPEADAPSDAGTRLRRVAEVFQEALDSQLRQHFLKEVHILHGSPTREALAGKRPAVSLALYRLAVAQNGALRLGLIVSAWSHRAEEEHELLGVLHGLLSRGLPHELDGRKLTPRVQESYDFDLLHRFWSSHGHPIRASLVLDVEMT